MKPLPTVYWLATKQGFAFAGILLTSLTNHVDHPVDDVVAVRVARQARYVRWVCPGIARSLASQQRGPDDVRNPARRRRVVRGGFLEPVDPADREDAGCWVNRQLVALAVDFFAVGVAVGDTPQAGGRR